MYTVYLLFALRIPRMWHMHTCGYRCTVAINVLCVCGCFVASIVRIYMRYRENRKSSIKYYKSLGARASDVSVDGIKSTLFRNNCNVLGIFIFIFNV